MNREILRIAEAMKEAYEGDPWYGKSASVLLSEADASLAFENPSGEHSMVEILWHMINWKEFVISRMREIPTKNIRVFEENDWRSIKPSEVTMWPDGLRRYHELHNELHFLIQQQKDELLHQTVPDRKYDFRKLLNGVMQHDIYHLGQIAYLQKLLSKTQRKIEGIKDGLNKRPALKRAGRC
jgi:uncharacterized damage-inducible protein DinB